MDILSVTGRFRMTRQFGPVTGARVARASKQEPSDPGALSHRASEGNENGPPANVVQSPEHLLTVGEMKYGKCVPDKKFSLSESWEANLNQAP